MNVLFITLYSYLQFLNSIDEQTVIIACYLSSAYLNTPCVHKSFRKLDQKRFSGYRVQADLWATQP